MSQKIDWTTIDTGWVSCTLMNGWTEQAGNPVRCRRFGKIVMIRGNVVPPSTKPTSTSQIVLKVPSGYEPAQYSRAVGAGQYTSYYRMELNVTGDLALGHKIRGATSAGGANVTENNNWDLVWYGVDMTYFVD